MISVERHSHAYNRPTVVEPGTGVPVIFGVLLRDADERWPGRNQLMLALAHHVPVVLLEARRPGALAPVKPRVERAGPNLLIMRNAMSLRLGRFGRRARPVSAAIDGYWFRRALRDVGIREYVFWLTLNEPRMLDYVKIDRLVYDCMDPCFLPKHQSAHDRTEALIAAKSRVVFCSAHSLHRKMVQHNPNTVLLPNATEDACLLPVPEGHSVPLSVAGRPRPFVGYMGTLDWRFAPEYVAAAARALPASTFIMVGRINPDQESRIATLRAIPNVVLTGQVSYEDGLAYSRSFDVGLIPFSPGEMNDAINPVKMYMYLASGIPVIGTAVEECIRNEFVETASTPQEFAAAVARATRSTDSAAARRRREFAGANTWARRAELALQVLRHGGLA